MLNAEQMNVIKISTTDLMKLIRDIEDFPIAGITFKDISPLLGNPAAFQEIVSRMAEAIRDSQAEAIIGLDARGFIFGMAVAMKLNLPFIMARKPGKLPGETQGIDYGLEYGTNRLEIQVNAVKSGLKVAIVDDLLATGGTAKAAAQLVEEAGGIVAGCFFALELPELSGRKMLEGYYSYSVLEC